MPKTPKIHELIHDLASSLTALSLCLPELEKKLGRGVSEDIKQLLELSLAAEKEARHKLKKIRNYLEWNGE